MKWYGSRLTRCVSIHFVHSLILLISSCASQLQRVIRTGRTGHWLNHTKEHMLVGVKTHIDDSGNLKFPSWANRGLDTDVIVSEVRETSRKPEEVYGLIERMCPGGRKVGQYTLQATFYRLNAKPEHSSCFLTQKSSEE